VAKQQTDDYLHRSIVHLRRLSGAAIRKLETCFRPGALALRDQILDEPTNRQTAQPTGWRVPRTRLEASRDIAVAMGKSYRDHHYTGFLLQTWYQACGLDDDGDLHDLQDDGK
jgi:hypothetical protein